jgi:hypothetical protein
MRPQRRGILDALREAQELHGQLDLDMSTLQFPEHGNATTPKPFTYCLVTEKQCSSVHWSSCEQDPAEWWQFIICWRYGRQFSSLPRALGYFVTQSGCTMIYEHLTACPSQYSLYQLLTQALDLTYLFTNMHARCLYHGNFGAHSLALNAQQSVVVTGWYDENVVDTIPQYNREAATRDLTHFMALLCDYLQPFGYDSEHSAILNMCIQSLCDQIDACRCLTWQDLRCALQSILDQYKSHAVRCALYKNGARGLGG